VKDPALPDQPIGAAKNKICRRRERPRWVIR
jgi:hypothetical protein